MSNNDRVTMCRKKLVMSLGDKQHEYWNCYQQWFKGHYKKNEFDERCRRLFTSPEQTDLHEELLLAIYSKVQGLVNLSAASPTINTENLTKPNKRTRPSHTSTSPRRLVFEPVDYNDYVPDYVPPKKRYDVNGIEINLERYASRELCLPDRSLILGRLLISAYELNIDAAEEGAADMLVQAVQVLLKNVLSVVITSRRTYMTHDTHFQYNVGCAVPNPWIRNSNNVLNHWADERVPRMMPSLERAEQELAFSIACSGSRVTPRRKNISVQQLYDALKLHKNVIACEDMYLHTMERIVAELDDSEY